jgi:hypothetical protein
MEQVPLEKLQEWYTENYQNKVAGRRVTLEYIQPLIESLSKKFERKIIGKSFLKKDIYSIRIGTGKIKVLIWTQMHGNESSGTKALFDLFQFFENPGVLKSVCEKVLNDLTIICIPILNPDGADFYTRVNAQQIDLNRDVIDKKAGESAILQDILQKEQPEYCFNMHDQRTIFSVGEHKNPATISFLAPSEDVERTVTEGRKQTMHVINAMVGLLKQVIPNQIGRYTDEFYPTATGDNFQKMGFNTILIESGHYPDDYQREISRKFTFFALLQGLLYIATKPQEDNHLPYFDIPDNEQFYLDFIIKNAIYKEQSTDIGVQFQEVKSENGIVFIPKIEKVENLSAFSANKEMDAKGLVFEKEEDVVNWIKNIIY